MKEKYDSCVKELQGHAEAEQNFEEAFRKAREAFEAAELNIENAEDLIKKAEDTIQTETTSISKDTASIREAQAKMDDETAVAHQAIRLMNDAIVLLKKYESQMDASVQKADSDAHQKAQEDAGKAFKSNDGDAVIDKVVGVIEKVIDGNKKELSEWVKETQAVVDGLAQEIANSKKSRKQAKETLAEQKERLEDETRLMNSAKRHMEKSQDGLDAEDTWWKRMGKECEEYTSQEQLREAPKNGRNPLGVNEAAQTGPAGEFKLRRDAIRDELESLNGIKDKIKEIADKMKAKTKEF